MLCAYLAGRRWRWLVAHSTRNSDELQLVEREGACPGDADGEIVTAPGPINPEELRATVQDWLGGRCSRLGLEGPVSADRPPTTTRKPVTWEPGDRRVDDSHARATIAAAVDGAPTRFCVFGNPAAHRH